MDQLFIGFYLWMGGLSITDRWDSRIHLGKLKEIGKNPEKRDRFLKAVERELDQPTTLEKGILARKFINKFGVEKGFLINLVFMLLVFWPAFTLGFYYTSKIFQWSIFNVLSLFYLFIGFYAGVIFIMVLNTFNLRREFG